MLPSTGTNIKITCSRPLCTCYKGSIEMQGEGVAAIVHGGSREPFQRRWDLNRSFRMKDLKVRGSEGWSQNHRAGSLKYLESPRLAVAQSGLEKRRKFRKMLQVKVLQIQLC